MEIKAIHEVTTARVLRLALTNIENQKMTIEELRRGLFEIDNQDGEIAILDRQVWKKLGIE